METSLQAWLPVTNAPSPRERQGYCCTWYSRVDLPADAWEHRSDVGGGWWRYSKLIPFDAIEGPESITFPDGSEARQIAWDKPTQYIPTGGRKP